jgi:hypothetical protein
MIGESKSQILSLVPEEFGHLLARYVVYSRPEDEAGMDAVVSEAVRKMEEAGLSFPAVAKPDVGQRGDGVRPVRDENELRDYLNLFPGETDVVIQEMVDFPEEAGIMYIRRPVEREGAIFSITLKEFPSVRGDGRRTLRELIMADGRARRIRRVYFRRHEGDLNRVLAEGEVKQLVFSGNHCKGAVFKDGAHLATPKLLDIFHRIATAMPEFYFGRFDIRFRNAESLTEKKEFKIIEINGAGAEATHIWDARVRLGEAYRTLFRQFRKLFEIGSANRKRGHRPLGIIRFLKDAYLYRRLARRYPVAW